MVTDIYVGEDKDIHLDGANDIRTISGRSNLEQSVALSVMHITSQMIGNAVTPTQLGLLEERVQTYLQDDPQVQTVVSVTATTINRDSNTVTMSVECVEDESFEMTLPLST